MLQYVWTALYNVNFCNAVLQVRREEKGQENSMQTLFIREVGTCAPTVRSFKQALHSPHRERSSCSRSYQRQRLSQNMENRPVPAASIPEGCNRGEICGITSVVPAVSSVERLSAQDDFLGNDPIAVYITLLRYISMPEMLRSCPQV